jgi:hypothetical protein
MVVFHNKKNLSKIVYLPDDIGEVISMNYAFKNFTEKIEIN